MNSNNSLSLNFRRSFLIPWKKRLIINESQVQYGRDSLLTSAISEIKYGSTQLYINGIKANRIYEIGMKDRTGKKIKINFQSVMLFKTNKKMAQLYENIIESLQQHVTSRLTEEYIARLKNGEMITIGPVDVNREGIRMHYRRWFKKMEAFVAWPDVYKYLNLGRLHLYSNKEKKIRVSLKLQSVWNAVVLSDILDYIWKDGLDI